MPPMPLKRPDDCLTGRHLLATSQDVFGNCLGTPKLTEVVTKDRGSLRDSVFMQSRIRFLPRHPRHRCSPWPLARASVNGTLHPVSGLRESSSMQSRPRELAEQLIDHA